MKKLFIFFILFSLNSMAFAIEETSDKQILYLSDCIKIAIQKSPVVKKAKLAVTNADKDIKIAKSNYAPYFGTRVGYWQGVNSDRGFDDGYNKRFLPQFDIYFDQLLFDFGKTSANIDMNKFYKLASEYNYLNTLSDTMNDVKLKYFAVLEAKSIVEIEQNNLNISQKISDTTKKLFNENKKDEIDCINAEVYLSSAKMNLTKAENQYNQTMADLANALYVAGEADFEIVPIDTFDYYEAYFMPEFLLAPKGTWHEITHRKRQEGTVGEVQNIPFTLDYAFESANKNNLELKVLNRTLDGMQKSELALKRQYYPTLKGRVGYQYATKYTEITDHTFHNNQLNLTVAADTGINPIRYSNELKKINSQIEMMKSDIELFRQNMHFEVKKCYMDVETAQKQILNAKNKVFKAKENLEIANKEYSKNKIGYLEFQSARQNYNSSKIEYINELSAYNISLSRLERVTHIFEDNFKKLLYQDLDEKEKELLNL